MGDAIEKILWDRKEKDKNSTLLWNEWTSNDPRDYSCGTRDNEFICLIGSLDYNKKCVVSNLDGHSVWHFLSALSLFVLPLSVMVVDDIMLEVPRFQLPV